MMTNRELTLATALAVALVALQLLGALLPSNLTWGFHAFGFLPAPYLAGYLILAIAAILLVRRGTLQPAVTSLASVMERSPYQFLVGVIGLFILAGVAARIRVPLLGDGFFLVRNFAEALRGPSRSSTGTSLSPPPTSSPSSGCSTPRRTLGS